MQAVAERADEIGFERGSRIAHEANARDFSGLLRARRERPRGCRGGDKADELAPSYSITSSAPEINMLASYGTH
jgi:hypothetical protein